jgi:hypothetical protein
MAQVPFVQELSEGDFLLKAWPFLGIFLIECILFLAHWFIYLTVVEFFLGMNSTTVLIVRSALFALSFSFVIAALLSFRFSYLPVQLFYKFAAVWMGFLNFFFFAAILCQLIWLSLHVAGVHFAPAPARPIIACICFGVAFAAGIFGLLNAYMVRVRRVDVRLANLPSAWIGRTALLISDLHLGHINSARFARRMVSLAASLQPDIIFVAGDFFDGSKVDAEALAAPFKALAPPLGTFFSTGNHDEFGDSRAYLHAIKDAGIRILSNEKVVVEGVQILGVPYHDTTFPMRLTSTLEALKIDRTTASILISHVPNRLPIVEQAGVSLQLSGHTHGGQFVPFTWLTQRVFGKFTHGLHAFGSLQVFTSYGAGTWGPPMRVGTTPEIILLKFDE